jgi:dienelactone hydrolase
MMSKIILLFVCLSSQFCLAQKPVVDEALCKSFPEIGLTKISNNGNYVLYTVDFKNQPTKLFVQSTNGKFKREIIGVPAFGTFDIVKNDSLLVYLKQNDTLVFLNLFSEQETYIVGCQSYKVSNINGQQWLACHLLNKDLTLRNVTTGQSQVYLHVTDYLFSESGRMLLIKQQGNVKTDSTISLQLINLSNLSIALIWSGASVSCLKYDRSGSAIVFLEKDTLQPFTKVWYYTTGMQCALSLAQNELEKLSREYSISMREKDIRLSGDGRKIFINFIKKSEHKLLNDQSNVVIYDSKSKYLPLEQSKMISQGVVSSVKAVINVSTEKITLLEKPNDEMNFVSQLNEADNSNYLLNLSQNQWEGYPFNPTSTLYLIDTDNGSRFCIQKGLLAGAQPSFSPSGKYVYWYDGKRKSYFAYNIANKKTVCITCNIPYPVSDEQYDGSFTPLPYGYPSGPAGWTPNDHGVIIYDRYDIWNVDPNGNLPSVCLTKRYGRNNKIIFRCVNTSENEHLLNNDKIINDTGVLIICAFNESNKQNGFYRIKANGQSNPAKLIMTDDDYYFSDRYSFILFSIFCKKALNANVYLLKKSNASEYPNLYLTRDFIHFNKVSDLNPQHKYNWMTAELFKWKSFSGAFSEGILYKPENFDSSKKYPVIFCLYERFSAGVNLFKTPELSTGAINIPWFVSRGYLVFLPDIYFSVGQVGHSAYQYVISAAEALRQYSFIDSNKIGIAGHSWGGYEVNYLLTKSNFFAAALSAAGSCDFVSDYGTQGLVREDRRPMIELGQGRMGATLWQNSRAYIDNSPIFKADRINTPILLMHNKLDAQVPWSQGYEFFTGLRRLHKKAWMVEYNNEGHVLLDEKNQLDYTKKIENFFDHFLKESALSELP